VVETRTPRSLPSSGPPPMYVLCGPGENALVRWGRVRLILGLLLIITGFFMASRITNPSDPYGLGGVVLLSLTLVLTGLAVALWGPEWGCVPDQPGELCLSVADSLPGIWLAAVVGSGAAPHGRMPPLPPGS
jgi:hypothetical protein